LENSDDARGCPLTFILSPEGRVKGEGKGVSGVQPLNILKPGQKKEGKCLF